MLRKVNRHLLPLFFCVSLLCNMDRGNLAFAAPQLSADLRFTKATYGLGSGESSSSSRPCLPILCTSLGTKAGKHGVGAGVFFLGYAIFQVPATLLCARVGAPRFLGTSLICWGAVASLFAGVRSALQFYLLRFVLGLCETGAYPGAIPSSTTQHTSCARHSPGSRLLPCLWSAQQEQAADRMPGPTLLLAVRSGICRTHTCTRRDRVPAGMWYHLSTFLDDAELGVAYATVTTASALSAFVGGPAAALLLSMNGFAGLTGWQWYVLRPGAMHVGLTWAQTQGTQISPPSVACGPISLATGR